MEELLQEQERFFRYISSAYDNFKKCGKERMTAGATESRLQGLEEYKAKFDKNHTILTSTYKDLLKEQPYWKTDMVDRTEEAYIVQRGMLLDFRDLFAAKATVSAATAQPAQAKSRSTVRPIDLPTFDGKYEDWPAFKELFTSIINRDTGPEDVEKLQHLKVSLKGTAFSLVKNIPTTADNYPRAWKALTSHYENKRILVGLALSKLNSLTKMKSESASELEGIFLGVTSLVQSLEGIGRPIGSHEDLLVYLVVELLDDRTRNEWEMSTNSSSEPPSFGTLSSFLDRRLQTLNKLQVQKSDSKPANAKSKPTNSNQARSRSRNFHTSKSNPSKCPLCQGDHILLFCDSYKSKPGPERRRIVESANLCLNCLGKLHRAQDCKSPKTCQTCKERHHTTLHDAFHASPASMVLSQPHTSHTTHQCSFSASSVLLATARIQLADAFGRYHVARALVDQGSETSMITERLTQRLHLKRETTSVAIYGVGGVQTGVARGLVTLNLRSLSGDNDLSAKALVMPRLSVYANKLVHHDHDWAHLEGLTLADPTYYKNDQIDVILGADVHAVIVLAGLRKGQEHEPIAQSTTLGWILSGRLNEDEPTSKTLAFQCVTDDSLSRLVRSFWEQEELPQAGHSLTEEEKQCEEFFVTTHTRTPEGRYIVRLPLRQHHFNVSATRSNALRALSYSEKRFKRNPSYKQLYQDFMQQYEQLHHMTRITHQLSGTLVAYLPHHGVLRASSSTTKLRVVFNGSAKVASGVSLNDFLMTGPNLLPSLADVLLRWRMHAFVLVTDVEKMYRQILVDPRDRDLQRILWREHADEEIAEYRLNTVTYGLACAPYLAIRTMHQLARDNSTKFPLAATAILDDMYMDDVLSGASSEEELLELKIQLHALADEGCFPLQKWATNSTTLATKLTQDNQTNTSAVVLRENQDSQLILGLLWHPLTDTFSFSVKPLQPGQCTRRSILSQSAQLFDPLGWLTPMTVRAKILIQSTWLLKLDWDAPLPAAITNTWNKFREQWDSLASIQIPRRIIFCDKEHLQIMGYCDASEQAYAAVVYLQQSLPGQSPRFSLLSAKSKVAPLKQVSLPRLELCSARLLVHLTRHIISKLNLGKLPIHCWTDSTVTLGWIQGHPNRWKTYVANRVSEIQTLLPDASWHHIAGSNNPADCASRGISPVDLVHHPLWWSGPKPTSDGTLAHVPSFTDLPEQRGLSCAKIRVQPLEDNDVLNRFSSFNKLLRVTAYCLRWLARSRQQESSSRTACLTAQELDQAELHWIRISQATFFHQEISALVNSKPWSRSSTVLALTPFLDDQHVLRVGGRLQHSSLPLEQRHPIILSPSSKVTVLLALSCHLKTLHGGVQLTLSTLRQKYWVPRGRRLVKAVIHHCVTCTRWRAVPPQVLMGNLPASRVKAARPFLHTGVDYAGPLFLRTAAGRGHKSYKGFLVIFVCLSSRAVHLDVASDYTSEAFIAALKRFISRRGLCTDLYSDQGTNFVGADAELKRMFSAASKERQDISNFLTTSRITWHFNPPGAPHFGGIWEAAVKSTKFHLRRIVGEHKLTYEELATLLAQVEACLNSRPLCALSDDVDDLQALTPGHLLIGSALNQIPEPSLQQENLHHLSRWQLLTQMRDHFWRRWSTEYLHTMTPRLKWQKEGPTINPGALCLVLNEATAPARWPLGRVISVHPGPDGRVRVATVKTATSSLRRPVTKLILLPYSPTEN